MHGLSPTALETGKTKVKDWFEILQGRITAALEVLEREAPEVAHHGAFPPEHATAQSFVKTRWTRQEAGVQAGASDGEHGGGTMAILKGRLFEKAGVHVSTVYGQFAPEFASQIPGVGADRRFWASGISLIIHPINPNIPAVHFNTRLVVTGKSWFGGGADLTPVLDARRTQEDADSQDFHAAMKAACAAHAAVAPYQKYKDWCDAYFYLKHRKEPRGIGGIFYDYLETAPDHGGFDADFAFTRTVGEAFLEIYPKLVRRNFAKPYSDEQRHEQLVRRGRYVEFNLIYDRGTIFGLKTGGNVDSILSSMPPAVLFP